MLPEQWNHAIAASVAPVVIISASALMCLALYNRLAAIINRIRSVQRERLDTQERLEALNPEEIERGAALRLTCIQESLASQTLHIRRRARLVRGALLFLLATIALLVFTSLFNGVTVFIPVAAPLAAATFVLGLLSLLASVSCAALELSSALVPAEFETDMVSELTADFILFGNRKPDLGRNPLTQQSGMRSQKSKVFAAHVRRLLQFRAYG